MEILYLYRPQSITVATSVEEVSHGPPTDVRVESSGAHSLRVSWSPPAPAPARNLTLPAPAQYTITYTEVHTLPPLHTHTHTFADTQMRVIVGCPPQVESGREQFQLVEVDPSSASYTHTVTGLRPATAYSVTVAAAGAGAGAGGAAGAALLVRTDSAAPAAPPANLTAVPAGATVSTVSRSGTVLHLRFSDKRKVWSMHSVVFK